MRKLTRLLVSATLITAFTVTAHSTAASTPGRGGAAISDDEVLLAIQRDLGLTATQVRALRAQQDRAREVDAGLRASLGSAFGGAWFDVAAGMLVVNVTDRDRAAEVTKAGARAVVVKHSENDLDAIRADLDALSGRTPGTARARGVRSVLTGLAGWHVDPRTNSVVITTVKGQQRPAALDAFTKYGDAVRYEQTDRWPQLTTNYIDGGDEINGGCSAGFNLRNPSTGAGYLLTAGHCTASGQPNFGQGPVYFGRTVSSWFPGYDDALIRNDNANYWIQGPWVDHNPSNGGFISVSGHSDSMVGTIVCKSGITTKWTCGTITIKDEAVVYGGQGTPVYGLTRHSACVERGDSGGANVAALSAWSPEGVTSGAALYWDGTRHRCGSVFGYPNVSWYFPIADSLAYYGVVYGVTTW